MNQLPELAPLLLPWYEGCKRDLPWRQDREPYHVWLSEIMLQQTRVEAVKKYYLRFLAALPDIPALAACPEETLIKLWEGLGYYSRVRNLQRAARMICEDFGGVFPCRHADVRRLPGIGDYTAGAICSICFDAPTPAVDGNVLRILARLTGSREPTNTLRAKQAAADALTPRYPASDRGSFTQSLMELGALVCLPAGAPLCGSCPLQALCVSRRDELWRQIPVREEKRPRRTEEKTVFLLHCGDRLAIRKRPAGGLLAGLWEFPNVSGLLETQDALTRAADWGCGICTPRMTLEKEHIFTHIRWQMRGVCLDCTEEAPAFTWVTEEDLRRAYSMPSAFSKFLRDS